MKIRAIAALLLILCNASSLWGQSRVKITGYVRDADGSPLELVTVHVKNTLNGTVSNDKGYYALSVAPGDSVALIFACLGYNKAERIIPKVDRDMRINVQMNYSFEALGDVTVTAIRKQTSTMESLDAGRIRLLPDPAGGSIESLVVTYAGVSSGNELSSQYSVRGGSFDENMVYVNGLEVFRPLLTRSGQQEGLSFTNPELIESVNFAAGGFEARYGDKMSSVLDIAYKKPEKTEGSASLSFLGANAAVGSRFGKFTQITGIRYKTSRSLLNTMDTDAEFDPRFLDLQSYLTYRPSPKWEVNFLGNMASNSFNFTPYTRETAFGTTALIKKFKVYFDGKEEDRFETLYGALTLKTNPNEQTELGLQTAAFSSKEEETYDISGEYWLNDLGEEADNADDVTTALGVGRYHEHARNKLRSRIYTLGHYGRHTIKNHTLRWGGQLQFEKIKDRIGEWEKRDSSGYSLPYTGDGVNLIANLYSNNRLESSRISGYLQDTYKFRSRQGLFTLLAGIRGSYWSFNRELIISPRASLGFIPNFDQNLTFRLAGGIYYQAPFYKEMRLTTVDKDGNSIVTLNEQLKSQRSFHVILASDYTFRMAERNFKLTAEIYYKSLSDLNPYTVDNVKIRYYGENCASGNARGLDLKFFGEFVPGTDSWISFSLMKAQQTIRQTVTVLMPNSQQYNVALYFQDYFPGYKKVKLNLKGVLSGGLPITAPRKGYEDGYFRMAPYKRIDMGLSYLIAGEADSGARRPIAQKIKNIWIGLDLFNILDIKNVSSYYWVTDIHDQQYAVPNYLTGRQLNLRLVAEF